MRKILIFDQSVPQNKRAEGLAVYKAVMTGKCDICPYLKQCEKGEDFEFPKDAACMKILNAAN